MSTPVRIIALIVVLAVVIGLGLLATFDIPPPRSPVEKVLPDERFPR